jgi:hypothetical protein
MNLLLLKEEILKKNVVWVKKSAKANVKVLTDFIKTQEPQSALAADSLMAELNGLIDKATQRYQ